MSKLFPKCHVEMHGELELFIYISSTYDGTEWMVLTPELQKESVLVISSAHSYADDVTWIKLFVDISGTMVVLIR